MLRSSSFLPAGHSEMVFRALPICSFWVIFPIKHHEQNQLSLIMYEHYLFPFIYNASFASTPFHHIHTCIADLLPRFQQAIESQHISQNVGLDRPRQSSSSGRTCQNLTLMRCRQYLLGRLRFWKQRCYQSQVVWHYHQQKQFDVGFSPSYSMKTVLFRLTSQPS